MDEQQQHAGTEQQPMMQQVTPTPTTPRDSVVVQMKPTAQQASARATETTASLGLVATGAVHANAGKPMLEVPDKTAQALLMISDAQSNHRSQAKLPVGLLIALVTLVIVVAAASFLLSNIKPGGSSKVSSSPGPASPSSQTNPNSTKNISNQINKDASSCSNLVTALSQC